MRFMRARSLRYARGYSACSNTPPDSVVPVQATTARRCCAASFRAIVLAGGRNRFVRPNYSFKRTGSLTRFS